jgi:threonine dehydrogenase-like Zn-dependent dehydrogenase
MKALQFQAPQKPVLIDLPDPAPGPGEVLVKVLAVTTCPHWDIHLMSGEPMFPGRDLVYPYMAGQPGHEAAGEVAALGEDVDGLDVGDLVVVWRDRGHDKPGCYAQYVCVDRNDLLHIPSDRKPEDVASLELAMCVQVSVDQLGDRGGLADKRVAVNGLGPAGLVAVQLVLAAGAEEVTGIDPLPHRRALAEELGADRTLDPLAGRLPSGRSAPDAFDTAIDCTGLAPAVQALLDSTREAVALFGVLRDEVRYGFRHWGGLTLIGYGSHNRLAAERALGRLLDGRLTLAPLVSAVLPLTRYAEGVAMLRDRSALKICYQPWAG